MSGERTMRDWYAPLEIYTLASWLRVAVAVNIFLLFDYLREDGMLYSMAGIALMAMLVYSLPDGSTSWRRDVSLALSGCGLGRNSVHPFSSDRVRNLDGVMACDSGIHFSVLDFFTSRLEME